MPRKFLVSLPVIFAVTIVIILSYIVIALSAYQRGQQDYIEVSQVFLEELEEQKKISQYKEEEIQSYLQNRGITIKSEVLPYSSENFGIYSPNLEGTTIQLHEMVIKRNRLTEKRVREFIHTGDYDLLLTLYDFGKKIGNTSDVFEQEITQCEGGGCWYVKVQDLLSQEDLKVTTENYQNLHIKFYISPKSQTFNSQVEAYFLIESLPPKVFLGKVSVNKNTVVGSTSQLSNADMEKMTEAIVQFVETFEL